MAFPVGTFWWFNQPENFEEWLIEQRVSGCVYHYDSVIMVHRISSNVLDFYFVARVPSNFLK